MDYILIIGAKSDIAKAVARKYAECGYSLYLAARGSKDLNFFANDIAIRSQVIVKCLELDILDYESHKFFYDSLPNKPIGVISAVGYLGDQDEAQSNFLEVQKIINTNYVGVVSLIDIIANDFQNRQNGFIVGISSVAGDRGRKRNYLYGSAKAGFTTYLSGLRNRLHRSSVHVLTVNPGFVATKMTKGMHLPKQLTVGPEKVAIDIYNAQKKQVDVLYTKWIWRWIIILVKSIPESIFKKMDI